MNTKKGNFNIAVVPAYTGIETSTTGIVVAEFMDSAGTINGRRRDAIRRVVQAEELPGEVSLGEVITHVAELAQPYGPEARVIFSKEGSLANTISWLDAYSRTKELARRPRPVSIVGDGFGQDGDGHETVGEDELLDKSLREQVKAAAFTIDESAIAVAKASQAMFPDVSALGRLKLGPRKRSSLAFALALALYPVFTPGHIGRRFRLRDGRVFDSHGQARLILGHAADQL